MRRSLPFFLAGPFLLASLPSCSLDGFAVFRDQKIDEYTLPENRVPAEQLEEIWVDVAPGVSVVMMLGKQAEPRIRPTILYLHGQGDTIDHIWPRVMLLWDAGYNVAALDYRGYGMSSGEPSEAGLYADAVTGFQTLRDHPELSRDQMVVWGSSLGCAMATYTAVETTPTALVLEAGFTSMTDMVEHSSPFSVPAKWITHTEFDNLSRMPHIHSPVAVAHGIEDNRVPFWMGEENFAAANEPKKWVPITGAGHHDVVDRGRDTILLALGELAPAVARP